MCGITGFVDFRKRSNLQLVRSMTDVMIHRGPNDSGYEMVETDNCQIGFGHRRLSILDLSPLGHQPYHHQDNILVYNGEIYNFQEIKQGLEESGISFASHSDTEVLIKSFCLNGTKAINQFIGMFAFAIYRKDLGKVYLVRDRAGVKPLYYYWKDGLLLFGSELKAFHQHSGFKKELDLDSLALYFKYSYVPTPYSIFKNTHKLRPGSYLEIDLKNQDIKEETYWDVYQYYNLPKLKISEEDAIDELDTLLKSAFNYRLVSDVPVGLFLSGGYDSSAVAALLQKDRTEKIRTFTIGFEDDKFNEAPFANEIANYLGTDHKEYYCTHNEALEIIPKLPDIYDEPLGDNSVIPTTLISQKAVQDVTVALSADGGDEIFGGYTRFNVSRRLTNTIPPLMLKTLAATMDMVNPGNIPYFNRKYNFSTRYKKMIRIWKSLDPVIAMDLISQFNLDDDLKARFIGEIKIRKTSFDDSELINASNDDVNRLLAIDFKTFLLDNNMTKVDRATMSVSLEGREPLLDHRIIEFLSTLPSDLKIRKGNKKYMLKELVHRYIPKELMMRPKQGFVVPIHGWFKKDLKDLLIEYLNKERIQREGLFDPENIQSLLNSFLNNRGENIQKLWHLLVFQLWKERWLN